MRNVVVGVVPQVEVTIDDWRTMRNFVVGVMPAPQVVVIIDGGVVHSLVMLQDPQLLLWHCWSARPRILHHRRRHHHCCSPVGFLEYPSFDHLVKKFQYEAFLHRVNRCFHRRN